MSSVSSGSSGSSGSRVPFDTARLFGTDGIRGRFGDPPLDQPTVSAIGSSVTQWLKQASDTQPVQQLRIVLAGDTRESTHELGDWLVAGLRLGMKEGPCPLAPDSLTIHWGGVLPTPAVALLTQELDADLGIALSASHNPYPDNGIKLFGADGFKLNDDDEQALEVGIRAALAKHVPGAHVHSTDAAILGPSDPSMADRYVEYLTAFSSDSPAALAPLKIVLDTGHGAASNLARRVFEQLGATCAILNNQPNGRNINDQCGSTAPQQAARSVINQQADLGFSFDGDADRVLVVDEKGTVRDGDEVLYLWAKWLHSNKKLEPPAIVATSMSNLGLERALQDIGITVERCGVGDRAVVARLREKNLRLGGEQSGHMIDLSRSTTGDGLLTAIAIAHIVQAEHQPLSTLLQDFHRFPQRLENVPVASKPTFDSVPVIAAAAQEITDELGASGRLVLRYSGTESLARVMIEAEDQATVDRLTKKLAELIASVLG